MDISSHLILKILDYLDLEKLQIIRKVCLEWKIIIDDIICKKLYIKHNVSNIYDLLKKIKCISCKTINILSINVIHNGQKSTYCRKCFVLNEIIKDYNCNICHYISLAHPFEKIDNQPVCKFCIESAFLKLISC